MMADVQLTLGPVAFGGFEVPPHIRFGGKQVLAVHRLPGGTRVIDAMGPDDAELTWSGVFTGADAGERARLLDVLRIGGLPLPLSWDAFFYSVLISELHLDYSNPWWIPYQISCTVLLDATIVVAEVAATVATAISQDLTSAAGYFDVTSLQTMLGISGATTQGTTNYNVAMAALMSASTSINTQIATAGSVTSANDVTTAVAGAGQLARLTAARGYVARSALNLANASS